MVVSGKPQAADKRARLVEGARELIYRQGLERTTLADIAAETNVPLGNIYYYFKTKDELVDAIVAAHAEDRDALLAGLERRKTPRARLKALIGVLDGTRDAVSRYGCQIGTLSTELDKRCGTDASAGSQRLSRSLIDWAERHFREMGQPDPRDLAVTLIAACEGTARLGHSLRDPSVIHRQSQRLRRWIDTLPDAATTEHGGLA